LRSQYAPTGKASGSRNRPINQAIDIIPKISKFQSVKIQSDEPKNHEDSKTLSFLTRAKFLDKILLRFNFNSIMEVQLP